MEEMEAEENVIVRTSKEASIRHLGFLVYVICNAFFGREKNWRKSLKCGK